MKIVVAADAYIGGEYYLSALRDTCGPGLTVEVVELPGTAVEQHHQQQVMEVKGPNAVGVPQALLGAVADADIVCGHFAPFGRALIAAAPRLKLLAVARSGLENVDLDAASATGVAVVPSHGRNAGAVAELQIGLMLAEARNIGRADHSTRAGGWRKDFPGPKIEIAGRTVGMIGFGRVGTAFARRLAGFGPRMIAYDPYVDPSKAAAYGVVLGSDLAEVLGAADFVVIQAKLTEETVRMIGVEELALLKPTAYFINVARSRIVDQEALLDAVSRGAIAGAGLDVFDEEPLPGDSPWRQLDNVTLTTHFGGDTEETNLRSARLVAEAIAKFVTDGSVPDAVNRARLSA
jgi:D-3-phosphoglycerate dehydrogenase